MYSLLVGNGPHQMSKTIGAVADFEPTESCNQMGAQPPPDDDLEPLD